MSKRPQEELCKTKLGRYLADFVPDKQLVWEDGSEPPDYWLDVGIARYAVEMTSIYASHTVAGKPMIEPMVFDANTDLVSAIEAAALKAGLLVGSYSVQFRRPIPNLKNKKKEIIDRALKYLEDTQSLSTADARGLWGANLDDCTIRKYAETGGRVLPFGPGRGAFEFQATEEVCELLGNALARKRHVLRLVSKPWVIVVHDNYGLANPDAYGKCTFAVDLMDEFAGVYVSSPDGGFFAVKDVC